MQKAKHHTSRRQALLVLGMHRSGTSALSGMLARLGVQSPKSLMVPTPDNPKGYWESTALMRFHDEVLASAGTAWSDWDRFNPEWMESTVAEDFIVRLPRILEQEYGESKLLLVKDPRICRLLPLWFRVLADLDITPKIVLPVRHPLEVARSLEVRNEFGRHRSYLAWLRHMLDAEYHSRDCKRIVIGYADLLMDWRKQVERMSAELDIRWPRWSSSVEADIDGFLTADLRHHAAGGELPADNSGIAGWVARTHRAFLQLSTAESAPDDTLYGLDQVRSEFDQSSAIYAAVVRECEVKAQSRVSRANQCVAETDERYTNLVSGLAALADAIQMEKADSMLVPVVDELTPLVERLCAAQVERMQSTKANAAEIADLSSRLEASQAALSQAKTTHEAELTQSTKVHAAEIADLSSRLEMSQVSLSQTKTTHEAELTQSTKVHAAEIADLSSRFEASQAAFVTQSAEIADRHSGEVRLLQEAKQQAEESLQARFAEVAKLTTMVLNLEGELAKERALRAGETLEGSSRVAGLERELELHRRLAADRARQLRCMEDDRLWKAATKLRRLVGLQQAAPLRDDPAVSDDEAIRKSGLFDSAWYLRRYSDVRKRGMDPLKHYLRYGASEGRDPAPGFSTTDYLRRYPDVATSDLNPLLHYVRYGIGEGRSARDPRQWQGQGKAD